MNRWIATMALALSYAPAQATITINVVAADLRAADGSLVPPSGQIFLVASPGDLVFGGPSSEAFVTGDDVILFRGSVNPGLPGVFLGTVNLSLDLFPGLTPGDPVQIYWFPTLTADSTRPGQGTAYGFYRHETGMDGSAPWVIPSDGSLVELRFMTASRNGSHSNSLGYASWATTPPVILSLAGAGTPNVVVTWSALSNLTYRVQYCPDFNTAWMDLIPDVTATNVTASATDHSGNVHQRFYRVTVVQ